MSQKPVKHECGFHCVLGVLWATFIVTATFIILMGWLLS